ncbi:MAG: hypothetical protein AVDCRST_MAG05-4006, partial [uncultured Rubrobacteraceae bacterium]
PGPPQGCRRRREHGPRRLPVLRRGDEDLWRRRRQPGGRRARHDGDEPHPHPPGRHRRTRQRPLRRGLRPRPRLRRHSRKPGRHQGAAANKGVV